MIKIPLNDIEKEKYGETALQFSLVSFGGIVVAQATSEKGVAIETAILGILLSLVGVITARLFFRGLDKGR